MAEEETNANQETKPDESAIPPSPLNGAGDDVGDVQNSSPNKHDEKEDIPPSPLDGDEPEDGEEDNEAKPEDVSDEDWLKSAGLDSADLKPIACGKNSYGEDVGISAEEQRKLAPFLKKAGINAASAKGVYDVLAKIVTARTEADNALYRQHIKTMAEEQKAFFGSDFNRTVREARVGLRKVFPNEYGKLLSSLPELGYSKDFLAGMAKIGRMFTNDDGTGGSASAEMNQEWNMQRWLAHDSK